MNNLANLSYVKIKNNPSSQVSKVLEKETALKAGGSYLALGFVGMQDGIVLVDSEGKIVTLPFDEKSFSEY